jgi:DUF438 domain-containing protein
MDGKLTDPPSKLPSELLSSKSCDEFASFFKSKIENIRSNIGSQLQSAHCPELVILRDNNPLMSEFSLIDINTLEKNLKSLNSSTCSLDTIPTNLFKNIFHVLSDSVLQIVNLSL